MGVTTLPAFFQHLMERLLASYLWSSVLVYIDDIIVYSRTLEDQLLHLDTVLTTLQSSGITLSLKKCHFAYKSVELL